MIIVPSYPAVVDAVVVCTAADSFIMCLEISRVRMVTVFGHFWSRGKCETFACGMFHRFVDAVVVVVLS